MQGKVIRKSVPNVPIQRLKNDDAPLNEEIIINSGENQIKNPSKEESKLRGARNRIKRNDPFTMNVYDGSSKSEKTETKPDGSIVRTIIEINGNQKKTTVITTKGGSTRTNTRIETVSGSGNNFNKGDNFGFGRMDSDFDSGFDNFNKMWEKQVNKMYNDFGNFGNERGFHYEYSSSSNNKGNKNNKNNKKEIKWDYDFGDNKNKKKINIDFDNDNNDNEDNNNKKDNWDYGWGTDDTSNNKKKENEKKKDDWDYGWGTDNNNSNQNKNKNNEESNSISGTDFQKNALDAHNNYRAKHHVGKLVLNQELCDIAQEYAEELARTGNFAHSGNSFHGDNMGENLFACYGMKITGKMMTDDWYNEVKQYDFNNPGYISGTGHFTQIVWKGSKQVGFGYAQARDGYYYGVANYYPAGNFIGEFEDNVFRA